MKRDKATIGEHRLARIARGTAWAICAAAAWTLPLFPAVRINLDAADGQGLAWTSFAIGNIVFGAVCIEICTLSLKKREFGSIAIYAPLAALFLTLNVMQSIGNAAIKSDHAREDRLSLIEKKQHLASNVAQTSQARQTQFEIVGDATPESIEADIQAKKAADAKRWNATGGCDLAKITAGASRDFCAELSRLEAKRAAALKRDELDAKLADMNKEDAGEAPGSVDPFADNIARFLGLFGYVASPQNKVLITSVRDWGKAIGVELLAIFGPAGLMLLIGAAFAARAGESEKPQEAAKPTRAACHGEERKAASAPILPPTATETDAEMHAFVARRLERCEGAEMRAGDLFKLWQDDCAENGTSSGTQKAFAARIKRFFVHDPNNGRPRYLGVRKKTAQPAIRMVVNN